MKNLFSQKIDRQFVSFICLLFTLHLSFRLLNWPGQYAWLIFIPVIFSLINLLVFIINGFFKSIWEFKYQLIILLYLMISVKICYWYYNVFICILLVAFSVYLLKFKFKISDLKNRLIPLIIINFILIIIPDISVFKYIHAVDNHIWGENLDWEDFQGSEPSDIGEMDATINSTMYWKHNRMYNFPRNISLAVMDKSKSWVRPEHNRYEGNLLNHEQLHFDITEWTRREFQDSLSNLDSKSIEKCRETYTYFKTKLSNRHSEYDSISKHGVDFVGQIKWNKKVESKLSSFP